MPRPGLSAQERIWHGELFADVFADPRSGASGYHFIVQRENSSDLLHWGREQSRAAALSAAQSLMEFLAKQRPSPRPSLRHDARLRPVVRTASRKRGWHVSPGVSESG